MKLKYRIFSIKEAEGIESLNQPTPTNPEPTGPAGFVVMLQGVAEGKGADEVSQALADRLSQQGNRITVTVADVTGLTVGQLLDPFATK